MTMRSLLFVPGDRPDRMEKALYSGADALILDLEDAVAPGAKPAARATVAAFVTAHPAARLWVRINPLDGAEADRDLDAVVGATSLRHRAAQGRGRRRRSPSLAVGSPSAAIATRTSLRSRLKPRRRCSSSAPMAAPSGSPG